MFKSSDQETALSEQTPIVQSNLTQAQVDKEWLAKHQDEVKRIVKPMDVDSGEDCSE